MKLNCYLEMNTLLDKATLSFLFLLLSQCGSILKRKNWLTIRSTYKVVVVVVVLLFYVHRKHLRSCRDGQLT